MGIKEYYKSLPIKDRKIVREAVLKKTGVNYTTFYRWINNDKCTRDYQQYILFKYLNDISFRNGID